MRFRVTLLSALSLLLAGCGGGGGGGAGPTPQVFDLGASAASFSRNPNGVWSFGYSATPAPAGAFVADTTFITNGDGVDLWHPGGVDATNGDPGYYPYVAQNTGAAATADPTGAWGVDPGQVAMEASGDGRYSLVRFTAPQTGTYRVSAAFAGIHFHLSTTDVHVLDNGVSVFDGDIIGYGGDPALHPVTGASPNASYTNTLPLNAGDVLTFAVGAGNSATDAGGVTNFNDTTGLRVTITAL